jgi:hypothetical protein
MNLNSKKIAIILVTIIFLIAFFIRIQLNEPIETHPGNMHSANALYHALAADSIANGDDPFSYPPYLADNKDNIINIVSQHQAFIIAPILKLTGIPEWNLSALIVALLSALAIPLMYLLTKKIFKSEIAGILSATLIAVPLNLQSWIYYTYIGIWLQSSAMTFILATFLLAFMYYEKPRNWKLLALSIVSTALFLLFPIALLITIPILIAVLFKIYKEKDKLLLYSSFPMVSVLIALPIYYIGYFTSESYTSFGINSIKEVFTSHPFIVGFSGFPILISILFALGAIQLLLNYKRYKPIVLYAIYFFTLLFLIPYIAPHGIKIYIMRMWSTLPYVVFPIAAYGTAALIKLASEKTKINKLLILILIIILIGIFAFPQYTATKDLVTYENINLEKYNGLKWIQDNTPEDAMVITVEGAYQGESYYTKRITNTIAIEEVANKINSLASTNFLNLSFAQGWSNTARWSKHRYKTGYLSYDTHEPLEAPEMIYDYDIVFMQNMDPTIAQYNSILAEELIQNHNFKKVHEEGGIIILQNEA